MYAKMTTQQEKAVQDDSDGAASQLSALVDEELGDREIELSLRRVLRHEEARDRWERYHLIGETMQGHLPDAFDREFAARIRQVIDAEPALKPARALPMWYKPVAGFGLAASVVLVSFAGFNLMREPAPDPALASVSPATRTASATPSAFVSRVAADRPSDIQSTLAEARLNNYWVNHNNYASFNTVNGMLPYVRMVGHQNNR